ncbi:MAG: hypothetical protein IPF48_04140 [Sphingomonadales bacterium]|nr:hypothetical protein [Sphingomonadales bacterium]
MGQIDGFLARVTAMAGRPCVALPCRFAHMVLLQRLARGRPAMQEAAEAIVSDSGFGKAIAFTFSPFRGSMRVDNSLLIEFNADRDSSLVCRGLLPARPKTTRCNGPLRAIPMFPWGFRAAETLE